MSFGQLFSADYVIEFNTSTGHYDCKVIIFEADVSNYQDRIIDASKFTVIVPTGTPVSFVESFSPYVNNENQDSTTPADWTLTSTDIAPAVQPENDYYQFTLDGGGLVSSFNDFIIGDILTLFSINVDSDCNLEVRPLDPNIDYTNISSTDYSQEIIQGGNSVFISYSSLPSTAVDDFIINESEYQNCIGGCVTITPDIICAPPILNYLWSTGETSESITVCPAINEVYSVTVTGPDVFPNFVESSTTVSVFIEEDFISFDDVEFFCVGNSYTAFSENGYENWSSSDISIASFDNDELFINGDGTVTISNTSPAGCITELDITTTAQPVASFEGPSTICMMQITSLSPNTGGVWVSDNPSVATVTNSGIVTGLGSGSAFLTFIANNTQCSATTSIPVTVLPAPFIQNTGSDQLCLGETTLMASADEGFWVSSVPGVASINNAGLVTPVSPGITTFIFTSSDNNCTAESNTITISPNPEVEIVGPTSICIGETSQVIPSTGGTWESSDNSIATINNAGIITGVSEGEAIFSFTDSASGCTSMVENIVAVSQCGEPCDDIANTSPWEFVSAGEFDQDYNIITYTTGSNLESSNDRDHLVFYDYNTGNVYLKENNGNGILDNERLLFNNEDHYANGNYHLYLEDIDNDGLTDIILAESNIVTTTGEIGDQISVYQNIDNYFFDRKINEKVCGMEGPNNLEIVDFDNDGMKDIYFICVDYIQGILFVNDWNSTDQLTFNNQNFYYTYTGDFNNDGFVDISNDDGDALINNGDRTFDEQSFVQYENVTPSYYYFIDESDILIDHILAFSIENEDDDFEFDLCRFFDGGDYENKIFRANINSPSEENVLIPKIEGFNYFETDLECANIADPFQVSNVVARHNTKIDLTLNGCTDFLSIEGNQIFAWINPKESNKILGTAFIDTNANGIYDGNEFPLRNVLVTIAPGDLSVLTDDEGNYAFSVTAGTYNITANVNEGEWVESELSINNIQVSDPCNEGYNFGFTSNSGPLEMATISMVNTIARCDFETKFTITVENTGEEALVGQLVFSFDDQTTFFSSDISGATTSGNTVTANIGPLDPFSPKSYKITVKMPSGSSNLPMLDFNAKLLSQSSTTIAEYGYSDQLRCSYDPNDKRAYPDREGDDNLTLFDEDLEYTIRFQNNGNDTAFLVKIVDPLDPSIDPSTIRLMSASHPVQTCIEDDNLIFLFEDILLVDSMTNYPGSQGYVTFRCNTKDGIAEFTPAYNQANIIFDTNAPIVTNQTINTLVSVLCNDKETNIEVSICEGDNYEEYTESGIYTEIFELPYGCDSVVVLMLDVQGITLAQNTVDICLGESIFFNDVNYDLTEDTEIVDTITNENGCISEILTLQVNVTQINFVQEAIMVCEGDEITINGNNYLLSESTEIVDSLMDGNGCITDIETYQIMVFPILYEQLDTTICEGFDVQGLTVAGTYVIDSFDLATGCPLTYTINLDVLPASDPECIVGTYDVDDNLVKLYPNPATESIVIETDQRWESIRIVDTQGKTVSIITPTTADKREISITHLPPGVYMIIFQDEEKNLTKRFVVN
jgi:uncharacterized repeat protein (TIGR01451 family)